MALTDLPVFAPRRDNFRAFAFRPSRIQNVDGNVFAHGRRQRRRMQHFRTKVRQLRRLIKTHLANDAGIGAKLRVGRHDAIHVRPDLNPGRTRARRRQSQH